jgi:hypothetical protein
MQDLHWTINSSDRGLTEVLPWQFPVGIEENQNSRYSQQQSNQAPTEQESRALLLLTEFGHFPSSYNFSNLSSY